MHAAINSFLLSKKYVDLDRFLCIFSCHFPGRERDEHEVKGYYSALAQLEQYASQNHPVTEKVIQTLHALVMSDGRTRLNPTPYRDGQNVIKDSGTGTIVYMPPEAKDVPGLSAT